MICLDQPSTAVRRLLRLLRRPHLLEREELAASLCRALQATSCRDAMVRLIDRTFANTPESQRLRESVVRCDVDGQKARAAAAGMHLSLRQFYRSRAEAIDALALSLARVDDSPIAPADRETPVYCAHCYRRITLSGESAQIARA
jgi:hypothetical protein